MSQHTVLISIPRSLQRNHSE